MATIQKLSAEMIGQIAAGEVVERPASAVKELVENSIDARARNVTVELRDGGISYLRITDNGCGIAPQQIRLAFERHATSKIVRPEDLFDLHTLGFRGEALASVAAVSRVTMVTRTAEQPFGTKAVVENGDFLTIEEAASPIGTSLTVEHLFQNVPARLKFLKKPQTEASYVADYLSRLILSRPDIAFRFVSQGKTLYRSPGDGKTESAVLSVFDRETLSALRPVEGSMNGVLLRGFVGVGEQARGNRSQQSFFVNGRYFRNALLSRALEEACKGRVMMGRYPMCVLYLDVNPHSVDVNVHPNKLEVRFQNENAVYEAIQTLTAEALGKEVLQKRFSPSYTAEAAVMPEKRFATFSLVSKQDRDEKSAEDKTVSYLLPKTDAKVDMPSALHQEAVLYQVIRKNGKPEENAVFSTNGQDISSKQPETGKATGDKTVSYLQAEAVSKAPSASALHQDVVPYQVIRKGEKPDENRVSTPADHGVSTPMQPIDGKGTEVKADSVASIPAAENAEQLELTEKASPRYIGSAFNTYLIFEEGDSLLVVDQHAAHERVLYDKYLAQLEEGKASQMLLTPQMVPLTAQEMLRLHELLPVLTQSGFDVSVFDEKNAALRAVPLLFGVNAPPKELLMEALDEWDGVKKEITLDRLRRRMAQMACKHAIKGGDRLSEEQVKAFLDMCLQSDSIPTCPHGRPIVIELTRNAIEKRFSRIQK